MFAIINPRAGGGTALATWSRIEAHVRETTGPLDVFVSRHCKQLRSVLPYVLARGETEFLAVGGDGTVNAVLGAIVDLVSADLLPRITVGAVGLGSSNDFHKPFGRLIDGVPCRLDVVHASDHDVGLLEYEDAQQTSHRRHWFINASIGVAAEANLLFNFPDRLLRLLKRRATGAAINYAAVKAIVGNRQRDLALTVDEHAVAPARIRNLGIVKNPHFAGGLCYDSPHRPDSGRFYVHEIGPLTRPGLLWTLARLARGRFAGGRRTRSWLAAQATVRNGYGCFPVECDGEVVMARSAHFSILAQKVRVCS